MLIEMVTNDGIANTYESVVEKMEWGRPRGLAIHIHSYPSTYFHSGSPNSLHKSFEKELSR